MWLLTGLFTMPSIFQNTFLPQSFFKWNCFIKYSLHYLVISSYNIYSKVYECDGKHTLVQKQFN